MYSGGGEATMWSPDDDSKTQEQKDINRLNWELGSLRGMVHALETKLEEAERKIDMVNNLAMTALGEVDRLKTGKMSAIQDDRDGLDKIADWLYSGGKNE